MVLSEQYKQQNASAKVKLWCSSCWADRVITTNGKCFRCGSKLLRPKHWDVTLEKLELIINNRNGFVPLEIKKRLYLVPFDYLERFAGLNHDDVKVVGEFIEDLKERCKSFKV